MVRSFVFTSFRGCGLGDAKMKYMTPAASMEAVWPIEVEDFPAFIIAGDKGINFFFGPAEKAA